MATAAAADVKDVQDIHDTTGKIISRAMGWSVAAAILPVPYLDIAALGTVQVKMVRDLATAYGQDANDQTLNGTISALLGTLGATQAGGALVGPALKLIPGGGSVLGSVTVGAFGSAATYAIGKIFVKHFENGGSISNFSAEKVSEDLRKEFNAAKSDDKSKTA
jgi:uncharacterized protein (DUF697 family)